MRLTTLFLLLSLGVASCNQATQQEKKSIEDELVRLEQEVMQIHDDSMAEMENLNNYQKKIEAKMADAGSVEDSLILSQALNNLVLADSLMWDWMYGYEKPDETTPPQEMKQFFEAEKQKIAVVAETMNRAMQEAEMALK